MRTISNDVLQVLESSVINDTLLFLPGQLERKMYEKVNKVLHALGGVWNKKVKAHVFADSASVSIEQAILTGSYVDGVKDFDFFETPSEAARDLVALSGIQLGESCLEPSAGEGAIAKYVRFLNANLEVCELNDGRAKKLQDDNYVLAARNFFDLEKSYDVIIGNPPFSKQADLDHVTHMVKLAKRRVVSIMSLGVTFRQNKKTADFLALLAQQPHHKFIPLPDETFKQSGTLVSTVILVVDVARHG